MNCKRCAGLPPRPMDALELPGYAPEHGRNPDQFGIHPARRPGPLAAHRRSPCPPASGQHRPPIARCQLPRSSSVRCVPRPPPIRPLAACVDTRGRQSPASSPVPPRKKNRPADGSTRSPKRHPSPESCSQHPTEFGDYKREGLHYIAIARRTPHRHWTYVRFRPRKVHNRSKLRNLG